MEGVKERGKYEWRHRKWHPTGVDGGRGRKKIKCLAALARPPSGEKKKLVPAAAWKENGVGFDPTFSREGEGGAGGHCGGCKGTQM